ncbi:FCD domain-containing protein [Pseudomonas oryzihabitans]|uniref:FadR/GntR family transcriptional regulator n=1 Tax=Pseudomonas oryzihabitans TaxID=47885 RepID=UPI0011A6A7F2|nr:FCD domain-containing protein [Pseudomonas oryzihabitans]
MQIHTDDSARLALDALRNLVAQQSNLPDKPLPPERELANEFGVSRRSIRRALAVLEAEGQVWRRQGKGTYVGPTPPSAAFTLTQLSARTNFSEVMEARLHLEPNLAALAAQRASGEQRALIRRMAERTAFERLGSSEDADAIELWDSAFHRSIAEAAGNRLLLDLFEMLDAIRLDPIWRDLRHRARNAQRLLAYHDDHQALVEALDARDPVRAAAVMRAHLRALQLALDSVLQQTLEQAL